MSSSSSTPDPHLLRLAVSHAALAADLLPSRIPEIDARDIDALTFLRSHVATNTPVIVKGAAAAWPATAKWDAAYLSQAMGAAAVKVNVTPDGRAAWSVTPVNPADAVTRGCFVAPMQETMTLEEFFKRLDGCTSADVVYLSEQNGNFAGEFKHVRDDVPESLAWADAAFGCPADAFNIWIGDEQSVTTMHKDHYDNMCHPPTLSCILLLVLRGCALAITSPSFHPARLHCSYAVVSGTKRFFILPPAALPFVYYTPYEHMQWVKTSDGGKGTVWDMRPFGCEGDTSNAPPPPPAAADDDDAADGSDGDDDGAKADDKVPWIALDPSQPDLDQFPLFQHALPLLRMVEVCAGDVLYLPSLWLHHVEQQRAADGRPCIALNWWYDMAYTHSHYAHVQLMQDVGDVLSAPDSSQGL